MIKIVSCDTSYIGFSEIFMCHIEDDLGLLLNDNYDLANYFEGYVGTYEIEDEYEEDYDTRMEQILSDLSFEDMILDDFTIDELKSIDILPGSKLTEEEVENYIKALERDENLSKIID